MAGVECGLSGSVVGCGTRLVARVVLIGVRRVSFQHL